MSNAWNVGESHTSQIALFVNGESAGYANAGEKLGDLVNRIGRQRGFRTVSVYADGESVNPREDGATVIEELAEEKIEIRTKDQRA